MPIFSYSGPFLLGAWFGDGEGTLRFPDSLKAQDYEVNSKCLESLLLAYGNCLQTIGCLKFDIKLVEREENNVLESA